MKPNNRHQFYIIIIILAIMFLSNCGPGNKDMGGIAVQTVDPELTPLGDVHITLSSPSKKINKKGSSGKKGTCIFAPLPTGKDYTMVFRKPGFLPKTYNSIPVEKDRETAARVILQVDPGAIPGRWRIARGQAKKQASKAKKETTDKLETLGYLSGYKKAPKQKKVTFYAKEHTYDGLNLYNSGHAPEAILMDMKGKELHRWRYDINRVWKKTYDPRKYQHLFWRHVHLLENGYLLAIFEGHGMIKLDKDSNLLWDYPGGAHHDLQILPNGNIYTLTREKVRAPKYNPSEPLTLDFIALLSPGGKELSKISILECLENSKYADVLKKMKRRGDVLHTNRVEVLDGRLVSQSPAFKQGNLLISILYLDLVAVVDPEKKAVVWAMSGPWKRQHMPTVLENGRMMVFDNQFSPKGGSTVSRVLEFEPFTGKISWEFRGGRDAPFFTNDCGFFQRLPNGNTLISESNAGRAFEVTREKRIAWEFYNPHRAGKNNELIASLFEMHRIGPGYSLQWLKDSK